jgi:hypothetical protein
MTADHRSMTGGANWIRIDSETRREQHPACIDVAMGRRSPLRSQTGVDPAAREAFVAQERIVLKGLRRVEYPVAARVGALLALSAVLGGCSGGSGNGSVPTPAATTRVSLTVSSDANDQLTQFSAQLQSVTLSNSSGHSVTLFSTPAGVEFMHFNGTAGPLATATIEQDTYTSATVAVGGAQFGCERLDSSGALHLETFAYGYMPMGHVTVTLSQPIIVTGDSMGIALRLLVSQSATASSCDDYGGTSPAPYSITPSFELTAISPLDATATAQYLAVREYMGQISAFDATSGTLQLQVPPSLGQGSLPVPLQVSINDQTVLQGVTSTAGLSAGTFVTLDGTLQADGSVQATRVAVADPAAVNVRRGPVVNVWTAGTVVYIVPVQGQGPDFIVDEESFDFSASSFRISGELSNLQQLPFTATFTATNMVPGQNVYVSAPKYNFYAPPDYYAAAGTITLMPQTVDGTVYSAASSGNFTVYAVDLASQDLFPNLAVQGDQATLLTQPAQIQVYVDSNTQQLGSIPVSVGAPARFYGLVFNDGGVLRMDAAAVLDGLSP